MGKNATCGRAKLRLNVQMEHLQLRGYEWLIEVAFFVALRAVVM
jgi:hypothetical protein